MRSKPNLSTYIILIILGICSLIINIPPYLEEPLNPLRIPLIFGLIYVILICIIRIIIESRDYYNNNLYIGVNALFLLIMWIVCLIQPLPPKMFGIDYLAIIYYTEIGVFTIIIIISVLWTFKSWKKIKKNNNS